MCAAGEFDGFAPHREPRLMRQIFAVQDFPGSVIGLFHGNSLFGQRYDIFAFPVRERMRFAERRHRGAMPAVRRHPVRRTALR